jgi:hypothetical protein
LEFTTEKLESDWAVLTCTPSNHRENVLSCFPNPIFNYHQKNKYINIIKLRRTKKHQKRGWRGRK